MAFELTYHHTFIDVEILSVNLPRSRSEPALGSLMPVADEEEMQKETWLHPNHLPHSSYKVGAQRQGCKASQFRSSKY